MTKFLLVTTSVDQPALAEQLAYALVESRLAACVQIAGHVTSVYRWQGAVEQAAEWTVTAKTSEQHFPAIEAKIRQLHTYDCPEIVATQIVAGSENYLKWLDEQVS